MYEYLSALWINFQIFEFTLFFLISHAMLKRVMMWKKSLQRAPWSFCCFSDPLVCLLKIKWFSHKLLWFSHYMWLSQITIIVTHKWFSHKWLLLWHNCDSLSNLYDCHTQVFPLTIWGSATPPVPVGHVGFFTICEY